jgi:hypothetical protein
LSSGREHAAWLFGHLDAEAVEVHMVDGWLRGERDKVEVRRDTQLERRYEQNGFQLVGHLHTHPCDQHHSVGDERAWTRLARELGRPTVGLIVAGSSPDSSFPFAEPLFAAWIAGPNRIRSVSVTKENTGLLHSHHW